jgi:hypothetical protein
VPLTRSNTKESFGIKENNSWLFHHDNEPDHSSLLVRGFFGKKQHQNYASATLFTGFAPCGFFQYPKLNKPMKGRRCETIKEIKTASL